jgi:hypothetical protein
VVLELYLDWLAYCFNSNGRLHALLDSLVLGTKSLELLLDFCHPLRVDPNVSQDVEAANM